MNNGIWKDQKKNIDGFVIPPGRDRVALHSSSLQRTISTPHSSQFATPFYPGSLIRGNLKLFTLPLSFDFFRFYQIKVSEIFIQRSCLFK